MTDLIKETETLICPARELLRKYSSFLKGMKSPFNIFDRIRIEFRRNPGCALIDESDNNNLAFLLKRNNGEIVKTWTVSFDILNNLAKDIDYPINFCDDDARTALLMTLTDPNTKDYDLK